ncbi:MAG: peptidase MA family metallohydrolase [Bacteroidota bacterium]
MDILSLHINYQHLKEILNRLTYRAVCYSLLLLMALSMVGVMGNWQTAEAQYFQFGKNRVQYDDFKWRYIQSEHFDIYYYSDRNYYFGEFAAKSLESGYKQLAEDFRHEISERIEVIVYDSHNDFSQTNVVNLPVDAEGIGGVTDKYKNRITIPFMGDFADFRHTLHHELVHAVINDMYYGGSLQAIVQNNIQLRLPLWFEEGLAEYMSLGWDTNTDMFVRDATINNYLPPLPQISGYFSYRGGQSLWNYIVEEYGRQKIGEIMQTIRLTRSVESGFRQTLGLSIEELSDRWQDAMKERYFPEVAEREKLTEMGSLVSKDKKLGTYNTSPAISPQGDKIALITNKRGFLDIVVVSAIDGKVLKTLVRGEDNEQFEELNILNPNLAWSPDGKNLALSTKSRGRDELAIVDYETGKIKKIEFPDLDAIGSVAWSPDGKKIAFSANRGALQDIFVYNLETTEFTNITNDVISDMEPAWSSDSKTIYFVSQRGDKIELGKYGESYGQLSDESTYQTDIYAVRLGNSTAERLTKTPSWDEYQPALTQSGQLIFISDQNGIPNIYQLDLKNRVTKPMTDLQSGVMQMSISADGSRLVVNAINEGYLDVFLVKSPSSRLKQNQLKPNYWANRRTAESLNSRVPAIKYISQMYGDGLIDPYADLSIPEEMRVENHQKAERDSLQGEDGNIDFRNYVFADNFEEDSTYIDEEELNKFNPEGNTTDDGNYQPIKYRLKFSPDITYAAGELSTYYGAYGLTQILFSDLLGDYKIGFSSNLVFDLRNSNYSLQFANLKNRTNWYLNYFHSARQYQTIFGEMLRFRTYGGGLTFQYPFNKFERIEYGATVISVAKDYSAVGALGATDNEISTFAYPQVTFTSDHTLPGFLSPRGGHRFSASLTGSPPISDETLQFATLMGDFRKYVNLGRRYSLAFRASGAASFGRDSQTFFMGGMIGWINQKWGRQIPTDRLEDTFFTLPALPMRGHEYNTIYGDKFTLINAEFRFPMFAAILPGPIPVLPFYNLTGVAFFDAGAAWGFDDVNTPNVNEASLDLKVAREYVTQVQTPNGPGQVLAVDGDLLLGGGFGLRTIFLGLPFRYDVGWPYLREGGFGEPIHYFTIGIDF